MCQLWRGAWYAASFQAHTGWVEIDLLRRSERRIELRGRSDYYVMTH